MYWEQNHYFNGNGNEIKYNSLFNVIFNETNI